MAEKGVFEPVVVTPTRLERINLSDYRAIVIPDLKDIRKEAIERLRTFVSDGGGLWVAVGPRTDRDQFNQLFFADGDVDPWSCK